MDPEGFCMCRRRRGERTDGLGNGTSRNRWTKNVSHLIYRVVEHPHRDLFGTDGDSSMARRRRRRDDDSSGTCQHLHDVTVFCRVADRC